MPQIPSVTLTDVTADETHKREENPERCHPEEQDQAEEEEEERRMGTRMGTSQKTSHQEGEGRSREGQGKEQGGNAGRATRARAASGGARPR